jgi:hypothetical protein
MNTRVFTKPRPGLAQAGFLAVETRVSRFVIVHPECGWLIGLREYPAHPDATFSEFRTGLDHIAFTVSSRDVLEAWQGLLAEKGITQSDC